MTTREFIERCVSGNRTRPGSCSSVYFDGAHLYSYGDHYPLLVQVKTPDMRRYWVLNITGYSVTTSKHIGWASRSADFCLELPSDFRTSQDAEVTRQRVEHAAMEQKRAALEYLDKAPARAFRKREDAERKLSYARETLDAIRIPEQV